MYGVYIAECGRCVARYTYAQEVVLYWEKPSSHKIGGVALFRYDLDKLNFTAMNIELRIKEFYKVA